MNVVPPRKKVVLPNIRTMFEPRPGMTMFDADLSGADAQVVAWEAEDEDLKSAFRSGVKIHKKNAADMWGTRYTSLHDESPEKKKLYDEIKQGVHLTNYVGSASALAKVLGWTRHDADSFQKRWFSIHPGIKRWHERVRREVLTTSSVSNRFGYRIPLFDRADDALSVAIAWCPQSTVALTTFYGARNVDRVYNPEAYNRGIAHQTDRVHWLLQVHDSLVWEMRDADTHLIPHIKELLRVSIPYSDPLTIPWSIKKSKISWGDMSD